MINCRNQRAPTSQLTFCIYLLQSNPLNMNVGGKQIAGQIFQPFKAKEKQTNKNKTKQKYTTKQNKTLKTYTSLPYLN